jgi:hypothetical protein
VRRDLLKHDRFRPFGLVGQPREQPAKTVSDGHLALPAGAVLRLHRPSACELVGAAELLRVRLELEQQPPDPLAGGLEEARLDVDELAVDAVAKGTPAVLGQLLRLVNGEVLAAQVTGRERCHQRLPDGRDRGRVSGSRLHVGDPQLERAVVGTRSQIPPEVAEVGKQAAPTRPGNELGQLLPAGESRRDA